MTTRKFTLTEMVFVMALISLFGVLLLPVLAQADKKAEAISCMDKLKRVGLAGLQYCDENDGHFPGYRWGAAYGVRNKGGVMTQYLSEKFRTYSQAGEDSVLTCPVMQQTHPSGIAFHRTYSTNGYTSSVGHQGQALERDGGLMRLAEVAKPAHLSVFFDGLPNTQRDEGSWQYKPMGTYGDSIRAGMMQFPHENGENVFLADGHAEWVARDVLVNLEPRAAFWRGE